MCWLAVGIKLRTDQTLNLSVAVFSPVAVLIKFEFLASTEKFRDGGPSYCDALFLARKHVRVAGTDPRISLQLLWL